MDQTFLEVQSPQGPRKLSLGIDPLTIGRQIANSLVIEDTEASRFHCVIERSSGGYRVRDLGSRNGTKVNGKLIKTAPLEHGDVVTIGKTDLRLLTANGQKLDAAQRAGATAGAAAGAGTGAAAAKSGSSQIQLQPMPSDDDWSAGMERVDETTMMGVGPAEGLHKLADSLPDKAIDQSDIALLNARGQIAHPAGRGRSPQDTAAHSSEAVTLLRLLLLVCFRTRASDVHVEPKEDSYLVRVRIDGSMVDVARLKKETGTRLCAVVKILCDIDIAQRSIIQEGHFSSRVPDRRVDYRISFTPSMYGQKLVMRVLDTANAPQYIWDLGMPEWMFQEIERAVRADQGMVLVCGPTGSGKTASLYAVLRSIDSGERNVVTIEDPVEIQIGGITQMPVNDEQGNSFPNLLRSVLRQDPDVILVGEVRDGETAKVAMQAAITGHLVFSTVHSRDTIGTIFRLIDLGVEPYMVSSGLHLIVAQRLVRQLCPFCKVAMAPTPEQLKRLGKAAEGAEKIYRANGCPRCLQTGFAGRRAVFELLTMNDQIREVIIHNSTPAQILQAVADTKFTKLLQSGYHLVAEGVTTIDEIERVVGT
jgi:general secretion pathway protein E